MNWRCRLFGHKPRPVTIVRDQDGNALCVVRDDRGNRLACRRCRTVLRLRVTHT